MTFKPGKSGNPNGRPKGTGHRQQAFQTLVEPHRGDLFKKAIELALNGNEAMLRLFLDRMLPPKPTQEPLEIILEHGDFKDINDLESYSSRLIHAASEGQISPHEVRNLSTVIENHRKLMEHTELLRKAEVIQKIMEEFKLK